MHDEPAPDSAGLPRRWQFACYAVAAFLALFGSANQVGQLLGPSEWVPAGAFVWPGALLVVAAIGTALRHEWGLKLGFIICLMNFITSGFSVWDAFPAMSMGIEIPFLAACIYGMGACWWLLVVLRRDAPRGGRYLLVRRLPLRPRVRR